MAVTFLDVFTTSNITLDGKPLGKLILSRARAQQRAGQISFLVGPQSKRIISETRKQQLRVLRTKLARFGAKESVQVAIEKAFASQIRGGKLIKATKGIGAVPDVVFPDGTTGDVKAKAAIGKGATKESALDSLLDKSFSGIELTGGGGISLRERQKLFTGVESQSEEGVVPRLEAIKEGAVDQLITAKRTLKGAALQLKIIDILKNSGGLVNNIFAKAQLLSVSVILKVGQETDALNFVFKLGREDLLNPKIMSYKVDIDEKNNGIKLFADVKGSVMRDLLKLHRQAVVTATTDAIGSRDYAENEAVLALLDPIGQEKQNIGVESTKTHNSGSPVGRAANVLVTQKRPSGSNQSPTQKFISGVQLTAIIQRRLAQIMPKGPRRGSPLSPNILTERTGRFRTSVTVFPNYRQNLIRYTYDPIYKTFINTPRNPDEFVGKAIRESVQQLFGRQFNLVRQ